MQVKRSDSGWEGKGFECQNRPATHSPKTNKQTKNTKSSKDSLREKSNYKKSMQETEGKVHLCGQLVELVVAS